MFLLPFFLCHNDSQRRNEQNSSALIRSILQFYDSVIHEPKDQTSVCFCRGPRCPISQTVSLPHFVLLWYTVCEVCDSDQIGPVKACFLCNYLKCSGSIRFICKRSKHLSRSLREVFFSFVFIQTLKWLQNLGSPGPAPKLVIFLLVLKRDFKCHAFI